MGPLPSLTAAASDAVAASALPAVSNDAAHHASFESMYQLVFPKIYAYMRCQVATTDIAQELTSRVFFKVYKHWQRAPAEPATIPWVLRIARNTLIDYWRTDKRRDAVNLPIDDFASLRALSSDPETTLRQQQRRSDMIRFINGLPEPDRELVSMRFAAHRTNREIAATLAISEAAVSMRLLRALRRLRAQLKGQGWD